MENYHGWYNKNVFMSIRLKYLGILNQQKSFFMKKLYTPVVVLSK